MMRLSRPSQTVLGKDSQLLAIELTIAALEVLYLSRSFTPNSDCLWVWPLSEVCSWGGTPHYSDVIVTQ